MLTLVLSFLMSFALVFAISPYVIRIAVAKKLVAGVEERSSHDTPTPCIGGVSVFFGVLFTSLLLTPLDAYGQLQYILSAMVIVFMVGIKDDIEGLSPKKKLVGLIVAISILVSRGDVQLASMYDLLGFSGEFPWIVAVLISGFVLLVITNAFNLIDGINGLSGVIGIIGMVSFGTYFFIVDEFYLVVLAMTTAGGLIAFLYFNITPARTFMGDTGALVIGLLLGVMTIKFIAIAGSPEIPAKYAFNNPIAVAVSVMIIPLFDTVRVFTTRILRGGSPFAPDRRHIHHLLVDAGLDHLQATAVLGLVNMLFISLVFSLDPYLELHVLITLQLGLALGATYWLVKNIRARNLQQQKLVAENAAPETVLTPGLKPSEA